MALSDGGALAEAERAFRKALSLSPNNSAASLNLAAFLKKNGRQREALQVLLDAAESEQILIQTGLVALQLDDVQLAGRSFGRALQLAPTSHVAWHGLGNARRRQGDLDSAEQCFRKSLNVAPDNARGWINLGVVLRLTGRAEDALPCLDRAQQLGFTGPELQDARNIALFDLGRIDEALAGARALALSQPAYAAGHETLVHLLWQHPSALLPGEDALDLLTRAVAQQPQHRALLLSYLQLLLSAKRPAMALDLLHRVRSEAQDDPWLNWYAAECLDALEEYPAAAIQFERAHRFFGERNVAFLNARARHAFRSRKFDLALNSTTAALRLSPHDQQALANLSVCWRLMDDPREHWLCDYDSLVGFVEVGAPPPYTSGEVFLRSLQSSLDQLHLAGREPLNQSVRNGSQSSGYLFGRRDTAIAAAAIALSAAAQAWASQLKDDPGHPFLARRRQGQRAVGSWSVRLWGQGHHSNHIHPEGWISSAFYVALPSSTSADASEGSYSGWIQFGSPIEDLGLQLPPRKLIRPKPGYLALFPSFFWHGTVPYSEPEPRLTIAFDLQPTERSTSGGSDLVQ
jgi:tetratricopeptide (TPR) repeat protein